MKQATNHSKNFQPFKLENANVRKFGKFIHSLYVVFVWTWTGQLEAKYKAPISLGMQTIVLVYCVAGNKGHPSSIKPQFEKSDDRVNLAMKSCDPRLHFALVCGAKVGTFENCIHNNNDISVLLCIILSVSENMCT